MAYYRNDLTGKAQFHPRSGLNLPGQTEIGEDSKPIKPRTGLAPEPEEIREARELLKDKTQTPSSRGKAAPQTPDADPGAGSTQQEGAD